MPTIVTCKKAVLDTHYLNFKTYYLWPTVLAKIIQLTLLDAAHKLPSSKFNNKFTKETDTLSGCKIPNGPLLT